MERIFITVLSCFRVWLATGELGFNVQHIIHVRMGFGNVNVVVVVALLFYFHGKHLRSCWDGQLT